MFEKIMLYIFILLTYLLFLLCLTPVHFFVSRISLPQNVSIQYVDGTLFAGKARNLSINGLLIPAFSWQLILHQGLPSIKLHLSIETKENTNNQIDPIAAEGIMQWRGNWRLIDAVIQLPAESVLPVVNNLVTASPQLAQNKKLTESLNKPINLMGELSLNIHSSEFAFAQCLELDANIRWSDANIELLGIELELDQINGQLSCEQNKLLMSLSQLSDQLESKLDLSLDVKKGFFDLNGQFSPQPNLSPSLMFFLDSLPKKSESGLRILKLQGKL